MIHHVFEKGTSKDVMIFYYMVQVVMKEIYYNCQTIFLKRQLKLA